ncbi:uncharacterized protein [Physcomitrium patens]|uniref:uncharacterized protein n=1 Tax=Physcomitrium patens TaxID=3218 RepID=UPI003CCD55A7
MANPYHAPIGADTALGASACRASNSYTDCTSCHVLRRSPLNRGTTANSDIGRLMLRRYSGNGRIACAATTCGVGAKGSAWISKGENHTILCAAALGWVNYPAAVAKRALRGYWN